MDKKKKMALQVPCDQPGMTVSFNEIAYRVGKRQILNSVTGAIRPGELLAIMGPSGRLLYQPDIETDRFNITFQKKDLEKRHFSIF